MKKLLFSAAMAAMLCAACTEGIDEVQTSTQFDTFSANMTTTRTDMGDDYSVLWNEGDLVTIFNKTTDNLQYEATNVDGTSATLTYKSGWREKKALENNYAIYPYDAEATLSDDVLSTSIAAEQTYQADNDLYYAVAVAKSANTSFNFSNATSLLRCHLNTVIGGTTLKSIKVESKSTEIAGKVTIDMANGTVAKVVEGEGSKTIILNCGDVELTNDFTIFNVALAAGTFSADDLTYTYTVDIDGEERTFEYPINKEVTFEAGAFRQTKFTFSESFDGNTSEAISYAEAIAEVLNSGQDVTLEKEVVLTKPLTITGTATLNLNGQTISANFSDKDNEAVIYNTGTLTLTGNGIIKNTAENGAAAINNSGNLILDGVTVQGAPIGETGYPAYAIYTSGKLTVEDGTTITADRGAISLIDGADVTINGGDISVNYPRNTSLTAHVIYAYGNDSKLTIKDGNFESTYTPTSDSGASIICPAGAKIYVYGGDFSFNGPSGQGGIFQNYMGYGVPVNVYGGTYSDTTVNKNLAEGYITSANDNGTYTVKAGVKLDNIADFETALSNAVPGSTIILPKNISETITVSEMKDVIIEGNENTTMIFSTNANTKIENVTLKKINFEYTGVADCGVVINQEAQIDNLVLEGCTFTGTGAKLGRGLSGFNNNASIVISNCTFKDMGYPIYAWGGYESLTIEGCTFNNIKSWAIMPQSGFDGDLTVDKCNFVDCLGGGLIKAGTLTAGHTFTFTNNTITGCTIAGDHNWFQFNVSAGNVVMSNNTKDGEPWTPGNAEGLK